MSCWPVWVWTFTSYKIVCGDSGEMRGKYNENTLLKWNRQDGWLGSEIVVQISSYKEFCNRFLYSPNWVSHHALLMQFLWSIQKLSIAWCSPWLYLIPYHGSTSFTLPWLYMYTSPLDRMYYSTIILFHSSWLYTHASTHAILDST